MKNITTLTGILSWLNLIIGSFLTFAMLLGMLMSGFQPQAIMGLLLMGSIVLHSYAAMQLRKSLIHPSIPLDTKTPTGIRFVGFIALFLSILAMSSSIVMIRNAEELATSVVFPYEVKGMEKVNVPAMFRGVGYFILFFSLSVAANVLINFTLLKKYLLEQNKD